MLVGYGKDPGARLPVAGLHLLEEQRDSACAVVGSLSSNGNTEGSIEGMVDAEVGVRAVDEGHESRASEPLNLSFVPFDNHAPDLKVGENVEDIGSELTESLCIGGVGLNSDPNGDGTGSNLAILYNGESYRLERRVLDSVGLHGIDDLRSDGIVPDGVEIRVEYAVRNLHGDLRKMGTRGGDVEGVGFEIRAIEELGGVARDTIPVEATLEGGDDVGRNDGESVRSVAHGCPERFGVAEGWRG